MSKLAEFTIRTFETGTVKIYSLVLFDSGKLKRILLNGVISAVRPKVRSFLNIWGFWIWPPLANSFHHHFPKCLRESDGGSYLQVGAKSRSGVWPVSVKKLQFKSTHQIQLCVAQSSQVFSI